MSLKRKATAALPSDPSKKPKVNASITSFFSAPPKTAASSSIQNPGSSTSAGTLSEPTPSFNKEKWEATLTEDQKSLLHLEITTLHPSWLAVLKDEIVTREFLDLKRFLKKEADSGQKIFPPLEEVYSWSQHTPLNTVKAVIIGQDPYHNFNQAHGLCFSVRAPIPAPPSLKNIYKALAIDYPSFSPPPNNGGLLTPWADRGVLLLNTCLTVRAHAANSHAKKGWERFTQKVIDVVAKQRKGGVVFLAWGASAEKRVARVGSNHLVLRSVHPSPLSAHRGFFECGHFRKTNEWLVEKYGEDGKIDWGLDGKSPTAGT